jgi:hypothetical protein
VGAEPALSEGEFSDLLRRVDDALQKIINTTNKIVDACTKAGKWLGPVWDNVVDLLHRFVGLVEKFLSEVGKFITRPGAPLTLWNVGNDWTHHVGKPVSDLVGAATVGQTQIDERWQGPAATAYLGTLPDQNKALAAIKAATDELDDALTKIAGGIIAFWVALLAALIPFIIELAGWLTAALTGIGAPAAAAGSGVSTAKVIALVTAIVGATVTYLTAITTQYKDLQQRVDNNEPFTHGSWPRSTNDVIADGSLTADNTTNWHLRTS